MSSGVCSRCGRERPVGLYDDGSTTAVPLQLLGEPEGSWASFDRQDVCPWCQSAAERREATYRVITAIEHEIERRQGEGISPDPYEAALVAYALALRARAESDTEAGPAAEPAHASDAAYGPHRLRLRVAMTGAFLTGHPLAVRLDDYGTLQRDLGRVLTSPQWSTDGLHARGGTYESGGGFSDDVPLVIARRDGADLLPWLSAAVPDSWAAGVSSHDRLLEWRLDAIPRSLAIDIYDLGVAVMTAWFDVVGTADIKLDEIAKALKQLVWLRPSEETLSPLTEALQKIATNTATEYGQALAATAPKVLQSAWLSRASQPSQHRSSELRPEEQGRLLWLHPVHVLSTAPESGESNLNELAPTFSERIRLNGGMFAAGIGSSAIVVSPESNADATPVRLTKLHWAYYALYLEIDRGLLEVLNQARWSARAPLRQLEADAEAVFSDYLRVMNARARLDSALSALGGDELAIWATIAKVQGFDTVVESVERKLATLEKLAQRRVTQATSDRARRIGDILGFLSVLTVVTVIVAVIGATLGSRSPGIGPVWVRVAAIVAAFVVASAAYWMTFVRTARGPASAARRRGAV